MQGLQPPACCGLGVLFWSQERGLGWLTTSDLCLRNGCMCDFFPSIGLNVASHICVLKFAGSPDTQQHTHCPAYLGTLVSPASWVHSSESLRLYIWFCWPHPVLVLCLEYPLPTLSARLPSICFSSSSPQKPFCPCTQFLILSCMPLTHHSHV
jgi:hypothetical protein